MMKYYFITYQAKNRIGEVSFWNQVIKVDPMCFILSNNVDKNYHSFVVTNTLEITEQQYEEYSEKF